MSTFWCLTCGRVGEISDAENLECAECGSIAAQIALSTAENCDDETWALIEDFVKPADKSKNRKED